MKTEHIPVLHDEVVNAFMEQSRLPLNFFEGTFGRGGHAKLLLDKFPKARVTSFDRDLDAIKFAEENFKDVKASGRLQVIHDDFRNFQKYNLGLFDGALLDLGVSSPQLDQAGRGFSFMQDGPLDMRMDQNQSTTAADLVNESTEKELSDIFYKFGEVRRPNRVVRAIVHDRKEIPFTSTLQLASLISRVERAGREGGRRAGGKNKRSHPATGYFQALRIVVNGELENLGEFVEGMHLHMEPGSRIVIISFHSLEDRIVKWVFRDMHKKYGKIINKKIIVPTDSEIEINPRARSAKMRIFELGGTL